MPIIFDIEADNLLDNVTKAWVFGWTTDGDNIYTTENPDEFLLALTQHKFAIAHNGIGYDFPLLEKLYGYVYKGVKVDTMINSWYLFPERSKHGLESLGVEHGIKKVEVGSQEWSKGDKSLMVGRVIEDVKITWAEWKKQERILVELYR